MTWIHTLGSWLVHVPAWMRDNPWSTLAIAFCVLSVVNGLLPARVRAGKVGYAVHWILDRLAALVRSDAPGTLKWPIIAGSIVRDLFPPTQSGRGTDTAPAPSAPKAPPLMILLCLALMLPACHPSPPPTDASMPAWCTVTSDVLTWMDRELQSVHDSGFPAPVTALATVALSEVHGAENALTAYERDRSIGLCAALYPAILAVVDATAGVIEALQVAGVPVPPGLVVAIEAGGSIVSQLAGVICPVPAPDAGTVAHLAARTSGYTQGTRPFVDAWLTAHGVPYVPVPPQLVVGRIAP